jgi:hypothetical protein
MLAHLRLSRGGKAGESLDKGIVCFAGLVSKKPDYSGTIMGTD